MSTENITETDVDDQDKFGDYRCQDCESTWSVDALDPITHLIQRVGPGEIMPAGQCPECGAVCHGPATAVHGIDDRLSRPRPCGLPPWGEP